MARNLSLQVISKLAPAELRGISEYDFQVAVCKYAEAQGWKVQYARKSATKGADGVWRGTGPKGWPDVFAIRRGAIVAIECKSEIGRVSPEQEAWLNALAENGCNECRRAMVMIAKPRDAATAMLLLE
jgi:hypothetical protein